ncbi:hypothetical protein G9U51_09440 [Calidifontibacter sp. DB0510]|uniref:Lysozyme n=1 Tax=Metallococcus carri TaxID=1656884 RepID=A0A967EH75_9MICO|nr:hypothetical protein [Metallococcus carri]
MTSTYGAVPGWSKKQVKAVPAVKAPRTMHTNRMQPNGVIGTKSSAAKGIDVSGYTGNVDWASFRSQGYTFAYAKASEGNYYTSKLGPSQVSGAKAAGFTTGMYHFANPSVSGGAEQADYFIARGGGWTPGSLPGVVDLEWNPYAGNSCYDLTNSAMQNWIVAFQDEYKAKTGTYPTIYTATAWWNQCIGTWGPTVALIAERSPLWLANYSGSVGSTPYAWANQKNWQYAAVDSGGYDLNQFNGDWAVLAAFSKIGY